MQVFSSGRTPPTRVATWFTSMKEKNRCVFMFYDVCEFYPSISEQLLLNALDFASKIARFISRLLADGQKRKRIVVWFNSPYSQNVKTQISKRFLGLVSKHFPPCSNLHKIFNRHTVKVSYSCTQNVAQIVKSHNHCVLNNDSRRPRMEE